jgi:two-component system response regulator FixJ
LSFGTVYIVDDDAAVRDSLRALLEAHLFDVEDFPSGLDFLARCTPDLRGCVVLDVNMPELDGFEVLVRLGGARPGLAVIVVTGRADGSTGPRAMASGASAFIEKPFAPEHLLALVRGTTAS